MGTFLLGAFIGSIIGVTAVALCKVASDSDKDQHS